MRTPFLLSGSALIISLLPILYRRWGLLDTW
jgi:hypothetical protein